MADTTPSTDANPYILSLADVQEPPATLGKALLKIGPGMILAASIVGTGELIATTHAGAMAGFALLWLVILSCFIKVFVQIELGRHAISNGETTLKSFSKLPGPGKAFTWWWFFMMLTTQTQISIMIGGVSYILNLVMPDVSANLANLPDPVGGYIAGHPVVPWAMLVALVTILLLIFGTYRLIERSMTILVGLFTISTVACVILLPFNEEYAFGFGEIASGLTFHLPMEDTVILAAVTMIGITGVGASELIAYPYWCIEKGYARNVGPNDGSESWLRRARGWLRVMSLDAWVSMIVYTLATLAFFILGASVLHAGDSKGLPNSLPELLESLIGMYAPVLGPDVAKAFIVCGSFVVLYSTLVSATAANSRTSTDFLRVNGFISPHHERDRFFWVRCFSIVLILFSLTLFLFFPEPVKMIMIGGFAQALTLPLIAAAAIYLRYKRTDGRLTPGLVWTIFLWLSFLTFVATAAIGLWSLC